MSRTSNLLSFGTETRRGPIAAKALWFGICLAVVAGCVRKQQWALTDIRGYLPDLKFTLTSAGGARVTEQDFRGKIVLLYFGYTHCPDTCPMMMSRLAGALRRMGSRASNIRILFVSVDPRRDTPSLVTAYAKAFSPSAVGATGTAAEIEKMAKRYRVAYQSEAPDATGNYAVMHSKGAYVFDKDGRVRLLIGDSDKPDAIVHDLERLVKPS